MRTAESRQGTFALMIAHSAGMVDLTTLPVWVGTLVQHYRFDPQQAGALATLFLVGAVIASVFLAKRFGRHSPRGIAAGGFVVSALSFVGLATTTAFAPMAILHALAGLSAGASLSMTHGTIGRSANPHRLFALVGIALGVSAVAFFAVVPRLVGIHGGPLFFLILAAVMTVAAAVSLTMFPAIAEAQEHATAPRSAAPLSAAVWFGIVGVSAMALTQAMTFSFLERVGHERGFGTDSLNAVLVALGFVNLLPAALAALLERHLPARRVMLIAPMVQAALAATIMTSPSLAPYAFAAAVFTAVMIFSHTFAFGMLGQLDRTGRALAATPAMLMVGAAIGPVLGGTLVKLSGYGSLAIAAACVDAVAVYCFYRVASPPAAPLGRRVRA